METLLNSCFPWSSLVTFKATLLRRTSTRRKERRRWAAVCTLSFLKRLRCGWQRRSRSFRARYSHTMMRFSIFHQSGHQHTVCFMQQPQVLLRGCRWIKYIKIKTQNSYLKFSSQETPQMHNISFNNLLRETISDWTLIQFDLISEKVQRRREEKGLDLPLLPTPRHSGNTTRSGGVSAAEWGTWAGPRGAGFMGNVVLSLICNFKPRRRAVPLFVSLPSQVNYRPKALVKGAPSSLYSQLPDTAEIQFAREMTEMQSEVEHTRAWHPLLTSSSGLCLKLIAS